MSKNLRFAWFLVFKAVGLPLTATVRRYLGNL
jgi:hypothetical protein